MVTPPISVSAPIPPVVPVVVFAVSSARSGSSSRSATSSFQSRERSWSRHSPESQPTPIRSLSVLAPTARGSWFCSPSGFQSHSQTQSSTRSGRHGCHSSGRGRVPTSLPLCGGHWIALLRLRPRLPAQVQASSSSVVPSVVESRSPLDYVPVYYSSRTSYRGHSPSMGPSRASFCAHSHSPLSKGCCSHSYRSPAARAVSLQGKLPRESSCRSRHSRSPSRASSRGGSASPDGLRRRSRSRSRSPSRRADEGHHEEQSLMDFVSVMATLRSLNGLMETSSENHKIRGFWAALEDDEQPASSYRLPVGDASSDILADIDDRVLSPSSACTRKRCQSCCSIQESVAAASTGLRGRK